MRANALAADLDLFASTAIVAFKSPPTGVTVAQQILGLLVVVQIHGRQPISNPPVLSPAWSSATGACQSLTDMGWEGHSSIAGCELRPRANAPVAAQQVEHHL